MAFPYSYKNRFELLDNKVKGEKLTVTRIIFLLKSEIKRKKLIEFDSNTNSVSCSMINEIFKIKFNVHIFVEQKGTDHNIVYEADLEKVIRMIIIGVVLAAFFSFLSLKYFFIFSGIFSVLFYVINVLLLSFNVERLIKQAIGVDNYSFDKTEIITAEQEEWIKNKYKCSGCGETLTDFDMNCPECGLYIKKKIPQVPFDISRYKDKRLLYHYKKKRNIKP